MPTLDSRGRSRRALGVLVLSLGLGTAALAGPANAAGTVPSAPRNVSASVSGSTVTVHWTAPTSAGSSHITGYDVGYSAGQYGNGGMVKPSARSDVFTHLSDGTYSFSVAAANAAGEGKRIFYVVNVGKHKGPSLGAFPTVVVAGQKATFMGIWKPGSKITLDRKLPGGSYHALVTIAVDNSGSYERTITAAHNAVYRTRTAAGLTSNAQRVNARSRMSLAVATTTGAYTLSGTVGPVSKGQAVTLSYSTGSGWTTAGTVHTDASGHWTFHHSTPAGAYTYRAVAAATAMNLGNVITRRATVS